MALLNQIAEDFATFAWSEWLVALLLGSGAFFLICSRFTPFRYIPHAFSVLRGKHQSRSDVGEVSSFKALAASLSGTIGLGNIAGVAVAIQIGGPGAIFWMWATAIFGIATKFFTCSLSVLFREVNAQGEVKAGPMYVIKNGLPSFMFPLATFFSLFGMIGCLSALQPNQMVQITKDLFFSDIENFQYFAAVFLMIVTALVILGGLTRIAEISAFLVPLMSGIYFLSVLVAVSINYDQFLPSLGLIFSEAFNSNTAVSGGLLGGVIITGVRRGAFSNEAGIGTEAMIHGAAKTSHPVKQGLVAMIGPIFDTLVMCTLTALLILTTGVWESSSSEGVTLTAEAFNSTLGLFGSIVLFLSVLCFGSSTIFTQAHYGSVCARYLFGDSAVSYYRYLVILATGVFSVVSIEFALNIIDGAFAMMAIPTLVSAIWLAPKVLKKSQEYFSTIKS